MTPDDALLARYLAGECTPAESAAVREWIAAQPDHERAIEQLRAVFNAASPAPPRPDLDAMWRKIRAPRRASFPVAARRRRRIPVTMLVAAAVAIAAIIGDR